ncbi:hypothetical protein MW695_18920 [Alkalihalobacillus sp. APA_J-10(15)]|nr:hypothetical protein [Halalkalibacter sp. APA_J-10(15)]
MWKKVIILFLLTFLSVQPLTGYSHSTDDSLDVVVIVVPALSFLETPLLFQSENSIWKDAAFAAMNVRPDGPYSYLNNMVTIGSGGKAVGVQEWNSYEDREYINGIRSRDWMEQLTGKVCSDCIIQPLFHRLVDKNKQTTYKAVPGRFGQLLINNQIGHRVYGHSDTNDEKIRYASLLTMNEEGYTEGDILLAIKDDQQFPYSMKMDRKFLIDRLSTTNAQRTFSVIEWGDFHRLFSLKPFMEKEHFNNQLSILLHELTLFVEQITAESDVWLIAPMMHQEAYELRYQLAPVFYWSSDHAGGTLTSQTTRRHGLVSSIDFIPTWLKSFEVDVDSYWTGQPMQVVDPSVHAKTIHDRVDDMVLIYKMRASVVSFYVTVLVISLLIAALFGWFNPHQRPVWRKWNRICLLAALMSPFWFLSLAPLVGSIGIIGFVFGLIIATFLSGFFFERFDRYPIAIIGGLTAVVITLDLFAGSWFMQRSFLGYDPIIGARYYGIGNEFVGVYMIAILMMISPFMYKKGLLSTVSLGLLSLFVFIVLGKSSLGTNAGAALASAVVFGFLFVKWLHLRIRKKSLILIMLFAVLLMLGLFSLQFGEQTHIGMAYERLIAGDVTYITDTVIRKLKMNVKLIRHSNWTQLFVTSYALVAIILWKERIQLRDKRKQLFLQSGVVASFALCVFNDSGVVAAAISMFSVVSTHYYWLAKCKERKEVGTFQSAKSTLPIEDKT